MNRFIIILMLGLAALVARAQVVIPQDQIENLVTDLQAINAALDNKASTSHTHTLSQLTQSGATDGQAVVWDQTLNDGAGGWRAGDVSASGSVSTVDGVAPVAGNVDLSGIRTHAPTIGALSSNALALGPKDYAIKTVSWSSNQELTYTGGTDEALDGQILDVTVTATMDLTLTPTSSTVYRNRSVSGHNTSFVTKLHPGRYLIQFTTPDDGTTLYMDDTVFYNMADAQFFFPEWGDGVGAVRVSTEGPGYGHFNFSGTAAKTANYVIYRWQVPKDFDQNIPLTCVFNQKLTGADTGKQRYEISMSSVTSSGNVSAPTFSNEVNIDFPGDASGANNDLEQSSEVTLTSWASSLTPGHMAVIKLARVGDDGTNDTSTTATQDISLTIYYNRVQP